MRTEPDVDAVADAIREVAGEVILPRFRHLADGEVAEKAPEELVTVADVEAEAQLTRFLADHLPDALVIGEETVAADPALLDAARTASRVWIIDPIDGTTNFVDGSPDFAVMVALVEAGRTTAAWIHHPVTERMFTAVLGGGTWADGRRVQREPAPARPGDLHGVVVTRLLDDETRTRVEGRAEAFGQLSPNRLSTGISYPLVIEGERDFVVYSRTLVWDHAAGQLLLEEAGGRVCHHDGADYRPWTERMGLILAADLATADVVRTVLAPDGEI